MEAVESTLGQKLWQPDSERIAHSNMVALARHLGITDGRAPGETASTQLYEFSVADPEAFWRGTWDHLGVLSAGDATPAMIPGPDGDLAATRFFPHVTLNLAEVLLAGAGAVNPDDEAISYHREDGPARHWTWASLRREVADLAGFLNERGVEPGDRVAAWMPNCPETVIFMLAATWCGAVFTSTSPDFGVSGVVDRFGQTAPKVLLAADGYRYAGKRHGRLDELGSIVAELSSVTTVVVHPELDSVTTSDWVERKEQDADGISWWTWGEATSQAETAVPLAPVRSGFDHPAAILYSSGTTGMPKCIVHRAGGLVLKHFVEHRYHCDVRPGDRVFYFTTCGWMMWNWLVSALGSGATVVLYDGSPFHPSADVLWDLAERERVTLFGTGAKYLDACSKAGVTPAETHDLSALRTVCSTGSPLVAERFGYVYESIRSDIHLASISGGTDLCGCFVMGDPTRPVYAGEIQGPALGMAVDVWNDEGQSLRDRPGSRGELVCTAAFPSMPLGFWADPEGARYRRAYFERFTGVWAHGDFAAWTEHGGIVIHGRSDATLNAGGVRIGTAELYRQVERFDEVVEALAIGQAWDDDTRIVLFVVLGHGVSLTDELDQRIRHRLRQECSPRHVPAVIVQVSDVPRTRSGKLAETAVADIVHGREVRNVAALANPDSLEQFARFAAESAPPEGTE